MRSFITLASAIVCTGALAQPMLNTECPVERSIRLPSGGTGLHMSADCKTAYILPPEAGKVTLDGITSSATLERCKELRILLKGLKGFTKDLAKEKSDAEISDILNRRNDLLSILGEEFGKTHAVRASLLYRSGYQDYVEKVRERNSHLPVTFKALPLKDTRLSFSSADDIQGLPMILSASIPGEEVMSGSVTGVVDLNLIGACPLTGAVGNRISPLVSSRKFASALPAQLKYSYDLVTTAHYEVSFNRGLLASQIRSVSSSGGFFRTETVSKLVSKTRSTSWFRYRELCDDTRACEKFHDQNVLDLKARLVDEVLSNITLAKFDVPLSPEAAGMPGRTGSDVGSENLKKCPHEYCQIAAGVLDVASATFGGTNKVDQYVRTHEHWAGETVTSNRAMSFSGSMGFEAED